MIKKLESSWINVDTKRDQLTELSIIDATYCYIDVTLMYDSNKSFNLANFKERIQLALEKIPRFACNLKENGLFENLYYNYGCYILETRCDDVTYSELKRKNFGYSMLEPITNNKYLLEARRKFISLIIQIIYIDDSIIIHFSLDHRIGDLSSLCTFLNIVQNADYPKPKQDNLDYYNLIKPSVKPYSPTIKTYIYYLYRMTDYINKWVSIKIIDYIDLFLIRNKMKTLKLNISKRNLKLLKDELSKEIQDKTMFISTNDCVVALINKAKVHSLDLVDEWDYLLGNIVNLRGKEGFHFDHDLIGNIDHINQYKFKVGEIKGKTLSELALINRKQINSVTKTSVFESSSQFIKTALIRDNPVQFNLNYFGAFSNIIKINISKLDLGFGQCNYYRANTDNFMQVINLAQSQFDGITFELFLSENQIEPLLKYPEIKKYCTLFST